MRGGTPLRPHQQRRRGGKGKGDELRGPASWSSWKQIRDGGRGSAAKGLPSLCSPCFLPSSHAGPWLFSRAFAHVAPLPGILPSRTAHSCFLRSLFSREDILNHHASEDATFFLCLTFFRGTYTAWHYTSVFSA